MIGIENYILIKKQQLESKKMMETQEYKKRQLDTKIYEFNKKYFPEVLWDGKKGTFKGDLDSVKVVEMKKVESILN